MTEELVSSDCFSEIQCLVDEGCIKTLSAKKDLTIDERQNYLASCALLADALGCVLTEIRCEHKGEIVSIAIAKALGIHIFLSNERVLQREIDECINTGLDDIRVFRMWDIIIWIKENPGCGLSRKDAKNIWLLSCYKNQIERYRTEFDSFWPAENYN